MPQLLGSDLPLLPNQGEMGFPHSLLPGWPEAPWLFVPFTFLQVVPHQLVSELHVHQNAGGVNLETGVP